MKEKYEVFHTSYLNEGQCKTDKDVMVLGHMAIITFPVCANAKRHQREQRRLRLTAKTTKLGLSCAKTKIVISIKLDLIKFTQIR